MRKFFFKDIWFLKISDLRITGFHLFSMDNNLKLSPTVYLLLEAKRYNWKENLGKFGKHQGLTKLRKFLCDWTFPGH